MCQLYRDRVTNPWRCSLHVYKSCKYVFFFWWEILGFCMFFSNDIFVTRLRYSWLGTTGEELVSFECLATSGPVGHSENFTHRGDLDEVRKYNEQLQESGSNLLQHLLLKQKTDCFHYCPVEADNQLDCHCLSITTQIVKTHEYILKDEPNSEFPSWHWRVADDCNTGRWFKFAMRLISKRCYLSMSLPTPHGVHSLGNAKILVCLLVLPSQYFPESSFSLNWHIIWVSRLSSNEWIAFFLIAMRHLNEMDAALAESWTKGIDEELGTQKGFFDDLNDLYLRIFQCSPWVSLVVSSCFGACFSCDLRLLGWLKIWCAAKSTNHIQ